MSNPHDVVIPPGYENIFLKTKVTGVEAQKKGLKVTFEGPDGETTDVFDRVLVAVGRRPNGRMIGASNWMPWATIEADPAIERLALRSDEDVSPG